MHHGKQRICALTCGEFSRKITKKFQLIFNENIISGADVLRIVRYWCQRILGPKYLGSEVSVHLKNVQYTVYTVEESNFNSVKRNQKIIIQLFIYVAGSYLSKVNSVELDHFRARSLRPRTIPSRHVTS